jgi:dipeptidyl aminopeptidase/acylaminoacyl peptidase
MKKTLLFICLSLLYISATGQTGSTVTPNYDLAARFSQKKMAKMVFSTAVQPRWFKNSNQFWYNYQTTQGTFYYIVNPATASKRLLFDNTWLAARLTQIVKDPFDAQNIPIDKFKLVDDKKFTFEIKSTQEIEVKDEKTGKPKKEKKVFGFEYDIVSGSLTEIKDYKADKPYPRWGSVSPDKKYVLYSKGFNFYWMDMENFEKARKNEEDSTIVEHQLTTDGTKNFSYGTGNTDPYADEKELKKRFPAYISWSPDSKYFAFVRSDESKVKDLWVIDVLAEPRPKLETYKYQMPGETGSSIEHLYHFSMETKSCKEIKVKAYKDQDVRIQNTPRLQKETFDDYNITKWLGSEKGFYLWRISRDMKRWDLCYSSVESDTLKLLVSESMNTYVETRPVRLINKGKEFIFWSEKSGWAQLYLYDENGKEKNAITSGDYHVEDVIAVDEANRVVYFTANCREQGENPYYTHQYRVNFDGTGLKLLNPGNFNHEAAICDDGKFFVDNYSRVNTVPVSALYNNAGQMIMELEKTDLSLLFRTGYKFPEIFTVKAGDGITDLYGVMYKPFDFDSTKKYPIIEYVYPGPQTEAVNASWSKSMDRIDRLAQLGFIVITVGNRGGSPQRSKWYHNYGYGNLRDYGLEDKKVVAERLAASHKWIDINKVGIHGHSGGGFMSTAAILTYPDFFKVAVSNAGNHENNIYNRWWSEQHNGVTEVISDKDTTFKYSIDKNTQLAKNLKGHLLLITGDIDNNVHPGNTLRMVNALIRANKRFDMLVLPGQRHGFGDMTEYYFWKMSDYFCRYLLGSSKEEVEIPELNNN